MHEAEGDAYRALYQSAYRWKIVCQYFPFALSPMLAYSGVYADTYNRE